MILSIGHACDGGNRTLRWSQFCDGIIDCHDRFDEEGHFCKLCINNLYACPPEDDIRCDLACKMLHYVPCQTIQDRRACNNIQNDFIIDYDNSFFQFFKEFKFYIVASIITLVILIGIIILIKYFIRVYKQHKVNYSIKSSDFSNIPTCSIETDTLSSHIYEQFYESTPNEITHKHPLTKTYYEYVV